MEIVLSGIRPTGNMHLGNYFGALKNWVRMQDEYNCYYFVADYHSLTTHPNPADLNRNVRQLMIEILACGVDPDKATIYVQSDLPETAELFLLLNMFAYKGELERSNSFKEKIRNQKENINAGLLTYPVLMAADILIHRANKVPVGKDQQQHLEMTRNYAQRFNRTYGVEIFPEPEPFSYTDELVKIPGLDGSGKMGKSEGEGNAIYLVDTPDDIRKKVMKAVTDSGPTENDQEKPDIIKNLFSLMSAISSSETVARFEADYNKCEIRYGDMKKQLAEDIISFTAPLKEKINEISDDDSYLKKVIKLGTEKARESASQTIKLAKDAIGMKMII
ncbi:MAG: tryptophan--tRNA ligase [Bacteroidetes bacterium]|nr:tryptophan--tRNA ligase [Bacteroidota bacterium]